MESDPSGWIVPLNAPKLTFGPDTNHCVILIVFAHSAPGLFITVPVPAYCPLRGNPPGAGAATAVVCAAGPPVEGVSGTYPSGAARTMFGGAVCTVVAQPATDAANRTAAQQKQPLIAINFEIACICNFPSMAYHRADLGLKE